MALEAARAAQAALQSAQPALQAGLWCREDAAATVMETYAAADGIDAATEAAIDQALTSALAGLPAGPRHVEAFRPA